MALVVPRLHALFAPVVGVLLLVKVIVMATSALGTPQVTQETVHDILTRPLQKASVFLSSGVRIIDTKGGNPVRVPLLAGMGSPSWHGENELIDEVDPSFDEIEILPTTMKSVKVLLRFSNELARQAVVEVGSALQQRLVADVAAKIDDALIAGVDSDNDRTVPVGLLNYGGVQSIDGVGAPTLDDLHDAEALALGAEVDPAALRWLMHSRDLVNIRKLKDSGGRYLVTPDPTQPGAYTLLGHQVQVTNRVPITDGVSQIALWDPSKVAVARDIDPTVKVLDQTFGDYDQQALRVVARYDAAALNPEAVVLLNGVEAPTAP